MATALFNAVGKAPGVYIQEIQVPGPIAGVATSIAAFVGPAQRGPIDTPTFVTNWTQFVNAFGGHFPTPVFFASHAIQGFFANGGSQCYFVRAGTGVRASLTLNDRQTAAAPALVVSAKVEGTAGNALQVAVQNASLASGLQVTRSGALALTSASNNQAVLANAADAAKLMPGDVVHLAEGANEEDAAVSSVSGATKTVTLDGALAHAYGATATVRVADLAVGQRRLRVSSVTGIEPGTSLTLTQGGTTESAVVASVQPANQVVNLSTGLKNAYGMDPAATAVTLQSSEFTLVVTPPSPAPAETYAGLSLDPRHSRYFRAAVQSPTVDVALADPPSPALPPANLPVAAAAAHLANGANDDPAALQAGHYHTAIDALEKKGDVTILCVPDRTDQDVQAYMIAHCEKMADRVAILDPQRNADPFGAILGQRNGLSSLSGFASLYYPRIAISNPLGEGVIVVPPSGHIAGVYARVDDARGVHKAPANEGVRGALALERELSDADQGTLNDQGIDVIRAFPGTGILIWGARTIAPQSRTQWRYTNVRRLLNYLEKSIQLGTQFAVFEPNDLALRQKVVRMVTEFLTRVWRAGALFGATAQEAFRVRADEELNPPDVRALGQLVIEVVVVPTVPAEFVVFQIVQDPTGAVLTEQ
jgi:phage tail sheath protein FI